MRTLGGNPRRNRRGYEERPWSASVAARLNVRTYSGNPRRKRRGYEERLRTAAKLRAELAAAGWSVLDRKDGYSLEPAKK